MQRAILGLFMASLSIGLGGYALRSAEHNKVVGIGKKAPAWKDLEGTDGKKHGLDGLKDAKAVVIAFTSNHCPIASAYEDRFIKFAKQYQEKGVAFVAISVSNLPEDQLDQMKKRAKEKGFTFHYLHDPSQKTGRAYGATVTPHLFVLDQDRKIAYMGAFDDNEDGPKKHYVKDAVDALLAGKKPPVEESRQFGCTIEYDDQT